MNLTFISGANSGIGQAIALKLASEGHDIILHYRSRPQDAESIKHQIEALDRRCYLFQKDLSALDTLEESLENFCQSIGRNPNYLVNNAAETNDGPFVLNSLPEIKRLQEVNTIAPLVLCQWFLKNLPRKSQAAIVNISSIAGQIGNPGQVTYSTSKAALLGATKALAKEFGRRNVRVNAIAAGIIETKMSQNIPQLAKIIEHIPLQRIGRPEEIASVVSFLLSDSASYITGETISVNGGLHCP